MTLAATLSRIGYCCAGWALTRLGRNSGSPTSRATNNTSSTNEAYERFIITSSYFHIHASIKRYVALPTLRPVSDQGAASRSGRARYLRTRFWLQTKALYL